MRQPTAAALMLSRLPTRFLAWPSPHCDEMERDAHAASFPLAAVRGEGQREGLSD